jgi:hypothetical protein
MAATVVVEKRGQQYPMDILSSLAGDTRLNLVTTSIGKIVAELAKIMLIRKIG